MVGLFLEVGGVELQTITKVVLNQEEEKSMDKIMKDYFSVEGFGVSPIAPTPVSKDEERAIQIMESTFKKKEILMKLVYYRSGITAK